MCGLRAWLIGFTASRNFSYLVFVEIIERDFSGYNFGSGLGQLLPLSQHAVLEVCADPQHDVGNLCLRAVK